MMFNIFTLLFVGAKGIICTSLRVDGNSQDCKAMYVIAGGVYTAFKLLAYRTLMAKAHIYDAMRQYELYHSIVWWWTHITYCSISICFFFLLLYANYTITPLPNPGDPTYCVFSPPWGASQTAMFACLLAFDMIESIGLISLLCVPIMHSLSPSVLSAVKYNIIGGIVGIVSTLIFGSFSMHLDSTGCYLPSVIIKAGMYDELVNLLAINLTWPMAYHIKAIQAVRKCDLTILDTRRMSFKKRNTLRKRQSNVTNARPTIQQPKDKEEVDLEAKKSPRSLDGIIPDMSTSPRIIT